MVGGPTGCHHEGRTKLKGEQWKRGIGMVTSGRCLRNISSARESLNGDILPETMEAGTQTSIDEDMRTARAFDAFAEGAARFSSSFNLSRIANSISMR